MSKVKIPLTFCKVGDIIADDVINVRGITLVAKNTVINNFIKIKLNEFGIFYIWIYESDENNFKNNKDSFIYNEVKKEYRSSVMYVKNIINSLSNGNGIDSEKLIEVTNMIYSYTDESGYVLDCINEVRNSDEYTYSHCVNVSFYSLLIARWLNMDEASIKSVIQAGLLHDIGKTKIPDEILNKKGCLTPQEFREIKRHTINGFNIIKDNKDIDTYIKKAVLMHHERIDGSGYPYGLTGDSIDLHTKIISVADVYDAMTSERVYKKRINPFKAFEIFILTGVGLYDTVVLRTLLNNLPQYYIGARVLMDNGEKGEIVYIPPNNVSNPIVRIDKRYIDLSKERNINISEII